MIKKVFLLSLIFILISASAMAARVHRVKPGEILYLIGKDSGVTVEEIISTNNLRNSELIYPGQVLIIPPKTVYYVRKGDSLYQITKQLDINLTDLIFKNNISNPDLIYPGQILKIPWRLKQDMLTTSVTSHQIQPGDTLYVISHKYGISINILININNISNVRNLQIGDTLSIPEYSFSQLRRMYPEHFFSRGNSNSRKIALTFDDGPEDIYTPQVLDVLKEHNIPATFFYMGQRIERYPEVVERTIKENHIIANHSWSHPDLTGLTDLEVYREIKDTEISMEKITDLQTSLLRPPYGLISQKIIEQLIDLDYRIIQWSVDSRDWQVRDVDQILINTLPDVDDGAILLFHTAGGGQSFQATVDALPELIYTLEIQGYKFVTVDELLDIPAYKN